MDIIHPRNLKSTAKSCIQWIGESLNLVLLVGILIPVYFVILFIRTYALSVPFSDQWEVNGKIAVRVSRGEFPLDDVLTPINGHIPLPTHLVTVISAYLFDWSPRTETFLSPVLAAANLILIVLLFRKYHPGLIRVLIIPFAAITFSLYQMDVWIYSENNAWLFASFFILMSLSAVYHFPPGVKPLIAAAAFMFCATFSLGSGLAMWFFVPVILWIRGYRRAYAFILWAVIAVLALFLFFSARDEAATTELSSTGLSDLPQMIRFFFSIIGSLLSLHIFEPDFSFPIGLVGTALVLMNLWFLWRRTRNLDRLFPILALPGYALGTAALITLSRFHSSIEASLATRYTAATGMFWMGVIASMVMVIDEIRRDDRRVSPLYRNLLRVNLMVGVLMIPLFLQANFVILQLMQTEYSRTLAYSHNAPLIADHCVLNYPLLRDDSCLRSFPFEGGTGAYYVNRLAAYRLTVFDEQERGFILPGTSDSPVIIETPTIWINLYIQDTLLNQMPDSQVLHIAPDAKNEFDVPLPRDVYSSVAIDSNEIEDFAGDSAQVWSIRAEESMENDAVLRETLISRGYVPVNVPIADARFAGARLVITRFQRPPEDLHEHYHFGENISLQAWSLDGNPRACDLMTVQSWWTSNAIPDFNYSATFVVVSESEDVIVRVDGELAAIPMTSWDLEALYLDERRLELPCDVPPGKYDLLLGIYDYETFEDLPVFLSDDSGVGNRAYLTTITINE